MNQQTPIISVRGLEARYENTVILHEIDLDIFPGQITVILGSSGSGKTTLIKNILRLEEPSKGSVKFWGEEVVGMDEQRFEHVLSKVGMLFQGGALMNSLTVSDNVSIPLEQHTNLSRDLIDSIIRVKLNLVRLSGVEYMLPSELSGGMRKRAALARAMALDPQILFCDEPTSGLDPNTAQAMDDLLLELNRILEMSIVVVTHDVATIHRLADRVIFIGEGRLLFQGTLADAKKSGLEQIGKFFSSGKYD